MSSVIPVFPEQEQKQAPQQSAPPQIYRALAEVKRALSAIPKLGQTTGRASYEYRRFDDVLNAVAPALDRAGVVIVGEVVEREQWREDKLLFVNIVKRYTFFAEDGSSVTCSTMGQAFDVGDKAATKAQTVAYRIALCETFNIPYDEMQDPEHGDQRGLPVHRPVCDVLRRRLSTAGDRNTVRRLVSEAIACLAGRGRGRLTHEELDSLKPDIEAAARRCNADDDDVETLMVYIDGQVAEVTSGRQEAPQDSGPEIVSEPVRAKECELLLQQCVEGESREKAVCTLLQSRFNGDITVEEFARLASEYGYMGDEADVAGHFLSALTSASSKAVVGEITADITSAGQQRRLGRDTVLVLSRFARDRIAELSDGGDE